MTASLYPKDQGSPERAKPMLEGEMEAPVINGNLHIAGGQEEDQALFSRLQNVLSPGGLGVSGIQETLSSLYEGSVHSLMVEEGFSEAGALCAQCGFMGLKGGDCPICRYPMALVSDIVDEAIASATRQDCEVYHITPGVGLEKLGRIGALLRYKTASARN